MISFDNLISQNSKALPFWKVPFSSHLRIFGYFQRKHLRIFGYFRIKNLRKPKKQIIFAPETYCFFDYGKRY